MESNLPMGAASYTSGDSLKLAMLPLYQARGWLRFLGVMSMIEAFINLISIVGIIVAWLPAWLGILLFQAAGDAERAYLTDDAMLLQAANRRLKTYFILRGVTILAQGAIFLLGVSVFGTLGFLDALT